MPPKPYMKWGRKRARSKPIYSRFPKKKVDDLHMRWMNRLMAMRHLQGGYAYPIKKKLASIQKTISQPKWHGKHRVGYRVHRRELRDLERRLAQLRPSR